MPSMSRSGRIADPVHGYVNFTSIERRILDHRVAQRLRYVSQNGLNHLVYPEVRSSRFSHSLGAMHLASEFLASCFRNAAPDVRTDVGDAITQAIQDAAGSVANPAHAGQELALEPALIAHHYCDQSHRPYVLLSEQSLRLAALFHDLGHLPFSHDFETAIGELWLGLSETEQQTSPLAKLMAQRQGQSQIHERLSHEVAKLLLRDIFAHAGQEFGGEAVRIAFEFARKILTSVEAPDAPPREAVVFWLHSLMDGEVDADRCDYILRDGRNYGFEFALYDLRRLLDNLVAARGTNTPFTLALKPLGLAAVETFLLARFRSYQYGVWHHKVAQVGAALRHSIVRILGPVQDERVRAFIADLGTITNGAVSDESDLLNRFALYDDTWWMNIMRQQAQSQADEWLNLVCWRQSGPRSLWKRPEGFPIAASISATSPDEALKEWNSRLPDPDDYGAQSNWSKAVSVLQTEGVLVMRHFFAPWKIDRNTKASRLCIQQNDRHGTLTAVSQLSPLVRILQDVWKENVQLHAFATQDCTLSAQDVINRLPIVQLKKEDR